MFPPMHHFWSDRRDRRQGNELMWCMRCYVWSHLRVDRVPVHLVVHISHEDERAVQPCRRFMQRLLRPLLLRALCHMPGVQRAQEPRPRSQHRVGGEFGEAGFHGGPCSTTSARRHDTILIITSKSNGRSICHLSVLNSGDACFPCLMSVSFKSDVKSSLLSFRCKVFCTLGSELYAHPVRLDCCFSLDYGDPPAVSSTIRSLFDPVSFQDNEVLCRRTCINKIYPEPENFYW